MKLELTSDTFAEWLANAPDGGLPFAESGAWPVRAGHGSFECIEVRPGVVFYLLDLLPCADVSLRATPGGGYLECSYHFVAMRKVPSTVPETAFAPASARRWTVAPDGNATHHEQAASWLAAAGLHDVRARIYPIIGCAGDVTWAAARAHASESGLTSSDVARLEALITRGSADYLPDQPGYVAFQPAMVVTGRH